jgi:uncharacterized protein (DUF983 family)
MLHAKCPRCRRGNIFKGLAYAFGSNKMHERCPHCNLHFEVEPGYFYASMYISYGNNVLEAAAIAFLTFIITHNTTSPWLYLSTLIGGCVILAPLNYRYSRIILLYWLSPKIHYQAKFDTNDKAGNI